MVVVTESQQLLRTLVAHKPTRFYSSIAPHDRSIAVARPREARLSPRLGIGTCSMKDRFLECSMRWPMLSSVVVFQTSERKR